MWLDRTVSNAVQIAPVVGIPLVTLLVILVLLLLFSRVPVTYVLGNLMVRWRITLLTALAFTLVVALLTVMLAFVNGMYALTRGSGFPENVLILSEGATDEGFSNFSFGDVGELETQPDIARWNERPLLSRETYLVVNQPIPNAPVGKPRRRFLQLRGIADSQVAARVHQMALHPGGTWFSEAGVRQQDQAGQSDNAIEVVIGEGIARELARDRPAGENSNRSPRLEVGETFALNGRIWLVVGVMRSSGTTTDSEVWAKQSLIGPMFGKESYSTLVARAETPEAARRLKEYLNKEYKKTPVACQIETEYFASLSETNKQFLYAIGFVTIFMAIGGVFGVMNTMYAAISQRVAEIGVLRLLGYGRHHLLATFLLESLLIALVGGVLGCLLGASCHGVTANSIVSSGTGGKFVVLRLTVDQQVIALNLVVTLAMGLLGGFLPSWRATRLAVLESLK